MSSFHCKASASQTLLRIVCTFQNDLCTHLWLWILCLRLASSYSTTKVTLSLNCCAVQQSLGIRAEKTFAPHHVLMNFDGNYLWAILWYLLNIRSTSTFILDFSIYIWKMSWENIHYWIAYKSHNWYIFKKRKKENERVWTSNWLLRSNFTFKNLSIFRFIYYKSKALWYTAF